MGKFCSPRVVPREQVRSPKFESRRGKVLRDGCACAARVKRGMRNVRRVHVTDIWSWYRVELRVGDHLGRSEELVSRCVECDLAEPESLASLGGSAPGLVDGILSEGDAQLIIELLHEHHTGNSQYSRSEINRITKYLTNIKLDDTWRGTNESFLMHYNDQLRLLDSLVDSDEKLPDNTRVTFLESAVESVPDLRRVKITDNVLQAQLDSTRPITYRSYFDLLKDAAFHLDQATK